MCGRFAQSASACDYHRLLRAGRTGDAILQRWNVAPGLDVAMVCEHEGRRLEPWHWGFVPHWARDPNALRRPINIRVETVAEKPMFRDAWRRGQRGLIPADGFYEWQAVHGGKQPWFIRRRDGEPMLLATLWDRWERAGQETLNTCAVLVGPANKLVEPLHERMPILIHPGDADRWLSRSTPLEEIAALLLPVTGDELEAYRVSTKVNSAINEGPELIIPV